jgi:hypothetical protein
MSRPGELHQNLATPDFPALLLELQQNGVTGVPVALISRIVDYNLFASAQTAISPEQWLRRSLVKESKPNAETGRACLWGRPLVCRFWQPPAASDKEHRRQQFRHGISIAKPEAS